MRELRLSLVLVAAGALAIACGSPSSSPSVAAPGATPDAPSETPPAPVAEVPPPRELPMPPSGKRFGATVYEGGVELRVWAPNAKSVAVRGDLAASLTPEGGGVFSTKVPGAKPGQRYRFALTTPDGSVLERLDPYARQVDGLDAIVVDPRTYAWKTSSFVPPKREESVVYEMHVGSFTAGGTFASAIDGLDSLAELGVNAVELMPVNLHGGSHGWGYNPQGYFAPHPSYGTPDDFRRFVDEAHARGIAVLLDVVYNHCDGWKQAPLRCFDGACPDGSAGVYFFDKDPYRATPWGPRLDYSKPEVADFIADSVFAWATELGADGFRQDSVSNVRAMDGKGSVPGGVDILRRMNDVMEKARPGALVIAEDLKGEASITAPAASGGMGFDAQWDGGFEWTLASSVSAGSDAGRNLQGVRSVILGSYNGDPMQRVLYVESHDTAGNDGARLPVKIDGKNPASWTARKRAMLAAGVTLTTPGVPMIFMGQESLDPTKFMPQPATVDRASHPEVRAFFRDAIHARRSLPGLRGKNVSVTHLNESAGNAVIIYRRWDAGGDDVMVVANFGATKYAQYDVGLPAGGAWKARLDGDDVRYGADFGASAPTPVTNVTATPRDGLPYKGTIALGPYAIVVLTR